MFPLAFVPLQFSRLASSFHHYSLDRNTAVRMDAVFVPPTPPLLPGCDVAARSNLPQEPPLLLRLVRLDSSHNNLAGERVAPINGMTNPPHSKISLSCITQRTVRHFLQLGPLGSERRDGGRRHRQLRRTLPGEMSSTRGLIVWPTSSSAPGRFKRAP